MRYKIITNVLIPLFSCCLLVSCQSLPTGKTYQDAVLSYDMEAYDLAADILMPLARQGDAESQFFLGKLYRTGRGVRKDKARGLNWYVKAAEQGHINAQMSLGNIYFKDNHKDKETSRNGINWYLKAAEQGHIKAQFKLGDIYASGWFYDDVKSEKWYVKAAEQGHIKSMSRLAYLYLGNSRDRWNKLAEGVKWARELIKHGDYNNGGSFWLKKMRGYCNNGFQRDCLALKGIEPPRKLTGKEKLALKVKEASLNPNFCQSNPFPVSDLEKLYKGLGRRCDASYNNFVRDANNYTGKESTYGTTGDSYSDALDCLIGAYEYKHLNSGYIVQSHIVSKLCRYDDPASRNGKLFKKDLESAKEGVEIHEKLRSSIQDINNKLNQREDNYNRSRNRNANSDTAWGSLARSLSQSTGQQGYLGSNSYTGGGLVTEADKIRSSTIKFAQKLQKRQNQRPKYIDYSSQVTKPRSTNNPQRSTSSSTNKQNTRPTQAASTSYHTTYVSPFSKKPKTNNNDKSNSEQETNGCWSGYEQGDGCLIATDTKWRDDIFTVTYRNDCQRMIAAKFCGEQNGGKWSCGQSALAGGQSRKWETYNATGRHKQIFTGISKRSEDMMCAQKINGWSSFPN